MIKFVLISLLILFSESNSQEIGINLYGLSYHIQRETSDNKDFNELNYGIGMRYSLNKDKRMELFIDSGFFKDSSAKLAKYMGFGLQFSLFNTFNIGFLGLIYQSKMINQGAPIVGAVPLISFSFKNICINSIIIPKIKNLVDYDSIGFYLTYCI